MVVRSVAWWRTDIIHTVIQVPKVCASGQERLAMCRKTESCREELPKMCSWDRHHNSYMLLSMFLRDTCLHHYID